MAVLPHLTVPPALAAVLARLAFLFQEHSGPSRPKVFALAVASAYRSLLLACHMVGPFPSFRVPLLGLFLLFFFKFIYLIYLFLAALGPLCCARAFSSCSEQGLLFIAVRGLITVASLVAEHRL